MKKIYLAGPKGFSEAGQYWFYKELIPLLEPHYEIINPWKCMPADEVARLNSMPPGPERVEGWSALNGKTFDDEIEWIRECDGMVADLDGADVDSGTAVEIGVAYMLRKPIVGYRGDWRVMRENEALIVNLMPQMAIERSGCKIVRTLDDILPAVDEFIGRKSA